MEARTAANRDEAIPVLRDEDGSKKKTKQPVQGEQTAGDHIQDRLLNKYVARCEAAASRTKHTKRVTD